MRGADCLGIKGALLPVLGGSNSMAAEGAQKQEHQPPLPGLSYAFGRVYIAHAQPWVAVAHGVAKEPPSLPAPAVPLYFPI